MGVVRSNRLYVAALEGDTYVQGKDMLGLVTNPNPRSVQVPGTEPPEESTQLRLLTQTPPAPQHALVAALGSQGTSPDGRPLFS